jgi:hypothetical protein
MDNFDSNDNKTDKQANSNIHQPEFILLDKERPDVEDEFAKQKNNQYFQALKMLQKIRPSLGLRLIILVSFVFLSIAVLVVSFFFLLNMVISMFALFQNANLNKNTSLSWKNLKKVFTFWIGVLIGFFSPSLGLGFIILYLMQEGEPLNKAILSRLFKAKFS